MKIIVSDLDGTLLRDDKSISERSLQALQKAVKHGYTFIIATARPKRAVDYILPARFPDHYLICYNGAEIYHNSSLVYSKYLDKNDVKNMVQWLISEYAGIKVALEISDRLYANFDINKMKGWPPQYTFVDFYSFDYQPAAKILVDLSGVNDINKILQALPQSSQMVVTDGGTLGQIAHKDISKMNAVKSLSAIIGFSANEVVSFGDDYNDLDMLTGSGIGIAMGNAPQEIKDAAQIIAETNENDGVAIELEKMLPADSGV